MPRKAAAGAKVKQEKDDPTGEEVKEIKT